MSKSSLSFENINLKDILESFNSIFESKYAVILTEYDTKMSNTSQRTFRPLYYHRLTLNEFEFIKKRKLKKETRCYIGN